MIKLFSFLLCCVIFLSSCDSIQHTRGNIPLPSTIESLEIGKTTTQDVLKNFGSPSVEGTFDNKVWYYIGWKKERYAFFEPEIIDHQVHILIFDNKDILQNHTLLTADDLKNIALNPDKTPTTGIQVSVIEQLLGNLGRFRNESN